MTLNLLSVTELRPLPLYLLPAQLFPDACPSPGSKFFLIHTRHPAAHVVPDSVLGTEAAGLKETGLALWHMQASGHLEPLRAPGLTGGFHAQPGKIPRAARQLSLYATTAEPTSLEPMLCRKRSHNEKPAHHT